MNRTRAVTGDHVLFNECIPMFRPEKIEILNDEKQNYAYLLLDFALTEPFQFEYFIIEPTIEVHLHGAYKAFISKVSIPKWLDHNAHLFTIGLSAVLSFITGRPTKAPRDGYFSNGEVLDQHSISELAIQFPVLSAGPGNHGVHLASEVISKFKENLHELLTLLYSIPYKQYETIMQSIRLVQLAHLNKREDFGLGYYLLVSAMEPIATTAIKRKRVVDSKQIKEEWKEIAKTDLQYKNLLDMYQQELSKNRYIGKRFVEYVMEYCPPNQWFDLDHPLENIKKYIDETSDHHQSGWITQKHWYETYPDDLNDNEIRTILTNVYDHRSKFTHEGKNPPHRSPYSYNRFFDKESFVEEIEGDFRHVEIILPNFQLIAFIARRSILNYLKKG
ncbi:hypothetical protein [Paenibacillus anseongense]|uniref:hypothetical protein n=1 Tax=Paenibacillus anseongense TaxID=2682845 RepID=UPI002DB8659B|nr:hypothetical protein [Paenibacillus anseongense]MEC0265125.1 hypothetical protein [Paenibacillus anseongense]